MGENALTLCFHRRVKQERPRNSTHFFRVCKGLPLRHAKNIKKSSSPAFLNLGARSENSNPGDRPLRPLQRGVRQSLPSYFSESVRLSVCPGIYPGEI